MTKIHLEITSKKQWETSQNVIKILKIDQKKKLKSGGKKLKSGLLSKFRDFSGSPGPIFNFRVFSGTFGSFPGTGHHDLLRAVKRQTQTCKVSGCSVTFPKSQNQIKDLQKILAHGQKEHGLSNDDIYVVWGLYINHIYYKPHILV